MNVFPERMNPLDVNDVRGSLVQLSQRLQYIEERVEYAISLLQPATNPTAAAEASRAAATKPRNGGT